MHTQRFLHSKKTWLSAFVLSASLAAMPAMAVNYSPDGYAISTPSDMGAISPNQLYRADDATQPYVTPWDQEDGLAQQAEQKNLLIQQADQMVANLDPNSAVADEWQQLRPQLLEILNKQSEVDELLGYITALSRVSKQQQDTVYLTSNQTQAELTEEQRAACDRKLLHNPVYAWPRCR